MPRNKYKKIFSLISLSNIRSLLRSPLGWILWASISILFAFVSLTMGSMLIFLHTGLSSMGLMINLKGTLPWFDYPQLFFQAPWGVMSLPFLPTLLMVLIDGGVGMGGAAAILLLLRKRSFHAAAGSAVAVMPTITTITFLATVGAACCATSAVWAILANDWFVSGFQIAMIIVSLLALEYNMLSSKNGVLRGTSAIKG